VFRAEAAKFYGAGEPELGDRFKQLNDNPRPAESQKDLSKIPREVAKFMGADYHEVES
jgi:hypothetical protein